MTEIKTVLQDAVGKGIVTSEQSGRLVELFAECGLMSSPADDAPAESGLDAPRDAEPVQAVEESESPRFVRGFHDILITIGVVAAIGGLSALVSSTAPLASAYVALVAVIVLAEILIRRQRLALPAFTLTVIYALAAVNIVWPFIDQLMGGRETAFAGVLILVAQPVVLLPFYWRYRVPVALALVILAAIGAIYLLLLSGIAASIGAGNIFEERPLIAAITGLVFSLGLFAVAMWFDMADPQRITRRSDVAFWLHLGVAPMLLYSLYAVITLVTGGGSLLRGEAGLEEALIAMAVVAVLMAIGIVIDRRAFVTSGLISLGAAIVVLAREANIDMASFAALPVFAVGLVVLMLGIGWQRLRAAVLRVMPQALTTRVPVAA